MINRLQALFAGIVLIFVATAVVAERMPPIEFDSYEEAFASLSENPSARSWEGQGWTMFVVEGDSTSATWTFSHSDHPAHPAVIKRAPIQLNGNLYVDMRIMCGGPKQACDELYEQFVKLNEKIGRRASEVH